MPFLQAQFSQTDLLLLAFLAFFEVMVVLSAARTLAEVWPRVRRGESPKVGQVVGLVIVGLALGGLLLMGAQLGPLVVGAQVALAAVTLAAALGLRTLGRMLAGWALLPALVGGGMLVLGLAALGRRLGAGALGDDWQAPVALVVLGAILLVSRLRALMGDTPEPLPDDPLERGASERVPPRKDEDSL